MGRLAGKISVAVNGTRYDTVGNFTYNLGEDKNEALVGSDRVHGHKSMPQAPFIEGEFRDGPDLNLRDLVTMQDGTVTLTLANGKTIVLREAFYAGEGTVQTEEANISARFEGMSASEE